MINRRDVRYAVGLDSTVDALVAAVRKEARAEALEEAARVCEARANSTGPQDAYATLDIVAYKGACGGCAFDIRALKGRAR